MRIMQVNGFAPTSQNRMTFKSKESSVPELLQEALLLFLDEYEAMQLAIKASARSAKEAETLGFSETLIEKFKALAEKAATALREGPSAPTDVKALVKDSSAPDGAKALIDADNVKALTTADRFFSINTSPNPTKEALGLYTQSTIRVAGIKQARPDLAPIFSQEA